MKAIDIWMAACLCFIFSSLLEYALVNVLERKSQRRRTSFALPEIESNPGSLQNKQVDIDTGRGGRVAAKFGDG